MTRRMRIDDLVSVAVPEQPALSPDGARLVYVVRTNDKDRDRVARHLEIAVLAGGEPRPLTFGGGDSTPRWSPDGTALAFLRAHDGPAQLCRLPADGGEPEQLTTLPLGAGAPVWSPDGTRIAFAAPTDLAAGPDEDDAAREKRSTAPIVTDRLDYRADGAGQLGTLRMAVFVLDAETKRCRRLTEGDWHAGEPAWSPDGRRLAFSAGLAADADLTMSSPAYVVEVGDGIATPVLVGPVGGVVGPIVWTADGAGLIFVGYRGAPAGHAGLFRIPVDGAGGSATDGILDLAGSLDRNVMSGGPGYPGASPVLVDAGRTVLFCARDQGCTQLYAVPLDGGRPPRLVLGGSGRVVAGLSPAGGTAAVVLATPTSFGEVVTVDLESGEETVRSACGAALTDVELFPRVERSFPISDGSSVQGWLIRDPAATGPQPLLLDLHGGPHNAWNGAADEVHLYHQELVARGWSVLLPNPRGSDGYGEKFYTGAIGRWGVADAPDVLEPIDALVADGTADPSRLAVAGYSYGGYLTCYLTSRDHRFAAAVAGGTVSDPTSFAGTSDLGHYLAEHEFGALPSANPAGYAAASPLAQVAAVRTPTLLLHGAEDLRCPIGQAEQWHTALREQGVPTRLVRYPGASHLFLLAGSPSHRQDFARRTVDWVQHHAGPDGARRAPLDAAHWQRRLAALAARHRITGASLGILRLGDGRPDEVVEAAYGVLNRDTGVPATPDSVFQIGSISKVWTATVALQLVDEGLLDLDAPIRQVLPELSLADPEATEKVTMRHLLTHTSGIDGDVFTDTGRGDDCLEKYVAQLADVPQNHPLGATWSYCNSGFSVVGRVIEKLTGGTWDAALRERIFTPLGLGHTGTLPEEALLFGAAVGHVSEGTAEPARAPVWIMPRSIGPAGLIFATAADVLAFARMHLTGGRSADGTQLLSEAAVVAMAARHAELPDKYSLGDSWGLGWIRYGWDSARLIGHDGNTIGQAAFLRLLPEQGLAVTLLTNGGDARDLYQDLFREIFADIAGVQMPLPLAPPAQLPIVDIGPHLGTYERAGARLEVLDRNGTGVLRVTVTGPIAELMPDPVEEFDLTPVDETGDLFVLKSQTAQTWTPVTFYSLPGGEEYLHFGARATPKVTTS